MSGSGRSVRILGLLLALLPVLAGGPATKGQAPGNEAGDMSTITLTRADNGRTVEVRTGDKVALRLEENLTTGYRWAPEATAGGAVVLEGSDYLPPGSAVGGGGERVFTFKAKKAGNATIRLELRREWEGEKSGAQTFTVTLRVHA